MLGIGFQFTVVGFQLSVYSLLCFILLHEYGVGVGFIRPKPTIFAGLINQAPTLTGEMPVLLTTNDYSLTTILTG
ncbi:MAG TPA: hypothetical protein DEG96_02890 [Candidatus Atribacteria bacterium]|nr:hypothetical protein [Candidatus Atribacteria bacterium]